jgi:hypothetical protein
MMTEPDEGTFAVRAEPAAVETTAATGPPRDGNRWPLPAGALPLVAVLALYVVAVRFLAGNIFFLAGLIALAAVAIATLRLWFRPARNAGTWPV